MRRVLLLALLAGLLALPMKPSVAQDGSFRASLEPLSSNSVSQGMPFRFKLLLENGTSEVMGPEISLKLVSTDDAAADPVVFYIWKGIIYPGKTETVQVPVTSSQWFAAIGDFRIEAESIVAQIEPLSFSVTAPTSVVTRMENVTLSSGAWTIQRSPNIKGYNYTAGAAWADIENDGDLDLFIPHQTGDAQLFVRNESLFEDQAAARGATNDGRLGLSGVFADYDNDGDPDLYINNDGRNTLLRNDGTGHFLDVTDAAGVGGDAPSSSASWGDYDSDGNLDLYVTNYGRCEPYCNHYFEDVLYHNEGDGTFTEQTHLLVPPGSTLGTGLQSSWFDYDHDGDQDLYLGNDYVGPSPQPNVLWRNDGPANDGSWKFSNVSAESGTGIAINTMGIGVGDFDRDLDFDMALSNIEATRLMRNNGDGSFTDVAKRARVDRPTQQDAEKSVTWALSFHDFNNDTWEDLLVVGGLIQGAYPEPRPNSMFVNQGNGRFLDLSALSGLGDGNGTGRGAAFADYDRDGRMDVYVVYQNGEPALYHNITRRRGNHWLEIDTVGTTSNRDGCGARLVATLDRTTKILRGVFCGSTSFAAGSEPTVHFGLGRFESVKRLRVEWPSGKVQILRDVAANQLLVVEEEAIG